MSEQVLTLMRDEAELLVDLLDQVEMERALFGMRSVERERQERS